MMLAHGVCGLNWRGIVIVGQPDFHRGQLFSLDGGNREFCRSAECREPGSFPILKLAKHSALEID